MQTKRSFNYLARSVIATPLALLGVLASTATAQINPGDCYVVDLDAGSNNAGQLFFVDPQNGNRAVVSDFSDSSQGPQGDNPIGLSFGNAGEVLVLDNTAGTGFYGAVFSVDVATGQREMLSDLGNANQGPLGFISFDVVQTSDDVIYIVDAASGAMNNGTVMTVDRSLGFRRIISDFGDSSQGPIGDSPVSIAEGDMGELLVTDANAGIDSRGYLFRVQRNTGQRTILTDFNSAAQGFLGSEPVAAVLGENGKLYVLDAEAGTDFNAVVFEVDPDSGARVLVSDLGSESQGPLGVAPISLGVDAGGRILVSDAAAGPNGIGAIIGIDPVTGDRRIQSDFGDGAQGPLGLTPQDVLVAPGGIPDLDSDNDTVPDSQDQCPNSDLSATVVLRSCDSGVDNAVLADGCTLSDNLNGAYTEPTSEPPKGRGKKAKADDGTGGVSALIRQYFSEGLITRKERRALDRCL